MKREDLSPEMQEKVEMGETAEELAGVAEAEGVELSDEDLDGIAGGILRRRLLHRKRTPLPKPVKVEPEEE